MNHLVSVNGEVLIMYTSAIFAFIIPMVENLSHNRLWKLSADYAFDKESI
jgi:hypothetical protein